MTTKQIRYGSKIQVHGFGFLTLKVNSICDSKNHFDAIVLNSGDIVSLSGDSIKKVLEY